jgi:MFS family permease
MALFTARPRSIRPSSRLPSLVWALASCQLVSRAGGFVQPFLLLYLTQERQLTLAAAGGVAAAVGAGSIGAQLVGGWLSDRIGRRDTMLVGFAGHVLGLAALGTAQTLPAIWVAALGVGLASELFRPASSAAVADLPGSEDRVRAFGLLFWAANVGFSISAATGGLLARTGYGALFWLNAAASVLAALIVWHGVPETRRGTPRAARRALLPVLLRDHLMITMAVIMVVHFSLFLQAFSTLPLVMAADGLGPAAYGAMLAGNGLVIVVAQPVAVRLLGGRDPGAVLGVSMLLVGLGLGLCTVADSSAEYTAAMLVWTAGEIGVAVVFGAMFADLAPTDQRGGYMGVATATWGLGSVLGPLLGTALLDHGGRTALWATSAAIGIALFAAQLAVAPALRRRTARGAQHVTIERKENPE